MESGGANRMHMRAPGGFQSLAIIEHVTLPNQDSARIVKGKHRVVCSDVVPGESGKNYLFTIKMRLTQHDGLWDPMIKTECKFTCHNGKEVTWFIGKQKHVSKEDGWMTIGGDFTCHQKAKAMQFQVAAERDSTDIEVDLMSAKLIRIHPNPNWKEEANQRIEKLRKSDVVVKVRLGSRYNPEKLHMKIEQIRSSFPFGTATSSGNLKGNNEWSRKYIEKIDEYFNWATPTYEIKWRMMEKEEGKPSFEKGDAILSHLPEGFQVRGHCIMWAKSNKIMSWLADKDAAGVEEAIDQRVKYLADHWGAKYAHWDVNNEMLHEAWYREKLQQVDFTARLFKKVHSALPTTKLFVNDYNVVCKPFFTMAYVQQIQQLLKQGAPLHGVGLQSHFGCAEEIEILDMRFNLLGEKGVPLWITEFDCANGGQEEGAQFTEDLVRLAFSHPCMEGIVVWGFWDRHNEDAPLMVGEDFKLTASGERLHRLWKEEWWTKSSLQLAPGVSCAEEEISLTTRAFHGTHRLVAEYDGQSIWCKTVQVDAGSSTLIYVDLA